MTGVQTCALPICSRLNIEAASKRVANYLNCSTEELKVFARITGHSNVHDMTVDDLCTLNSEISEHTNIKHT